MAKEYGVVNASPQRGRFTRQLILVCACFLIGYLSASFFDFTSLSSWVNAQIAEHLRPTLGAPKVLEAELPKPKLEFYTMLANDNKAGPVAEQLAINPPPTATAEPVRASVIASVKLAREEPVLLLNKTEKAVVEAMGAPTVVAKPTAIISSSSNHESFFVQVGAFRSWQEAERMKDRLVKKGYRVRVSTVNQQSTSWYRVNLGPFSSRFLAVKAQGSVAREQHIIGMIRKMDA